LLGHLTAGQDDAACEPWADGDHYQQRVEDLVLDLQGDGQQDGCCQAGRDTGAGAETVGDEERYPQERDGYRAFDRAVQSKQVYGQQGRDGHGRGGYWPSSPGD
jgi:hypothetical protein